MLRVVLVVCDLLGLPACLPSLLKELRGAEGSH